MSRGPGRIERRIIEILAQEGGARTHALAALVYTSGRLELLTDAQLISTRRALRNLAKRGHVTDLRLGRLGTGRLWALRNPAGQRAQLEQAKESAEKLIKILGMLGSTHDGEVLAAARTAEEFRKRSGATWSDIVKPRLPKP